MMISMAFLRDSGKPPNGKLPDAQICVNLYMGEKEESIEITVFQWISSEDDFVLWCHQESNKFAKWLNIFIFMN
ncbi:hypothetical protein Bache_3190 [Bacteroides helcogenes P 36-108]|uniref:Uncharacterized protein n=1 Tax=Bacteroides helcogenes (strain ATCC 35417 / DSM 20613 / JCM 6297 / CCUG 15421 / P 36-108) TaxID=693979 RepID=E6SRM4_BACT6|nr:hypothetical protein Bache_3190 [Bacteroides helcogenes P 36-108]